MNSPKRNAAALAGARGADSETLTHKLTRARPASQEPPEEPEHRCDRRRFLVWATMLGVVSPARMVERVLADVDRLP